MADFTAQTAALASKRITRGASASTSPAPGSLAAGGVDLGDGTAATIVSSAAQTSIVTSQTPLTGAAPAVQITSATPAVSRQSVMVTNSGANTLWVGPAGVTASTGIPIAAGASLPYPMPLGAGVALFGFSTAGSTAAVAEFN